ncbi:MAG TPA: hypothetical protein VN541_16925, partial [Tepidisphaeraceae bacterium]|nr:hypothetical protein [Tepidisphaeraceae bacterium]
MFHHPATTARDEGRPVLLSACKTVRARCTSHGPGRRKALGHGDQGWAGETITAQLALMSSSSMDNPTARMLE